MRDPAARPPLSLYLREWLWTWARFRIRPDARAAAGRDGGGQPVLVIPGFLAGDRFTTALRATLDLAGYHAFPWEGGINRGPHDGLFEQLSDRLDAIEGESPGPVTIVGWSLGGVFAREIAKRRPERVARVVTLGTPFSGDPRNNRLRALYEVVTRQSVDQPPDGITAHEKPPVPTLALWSWSDGIVPPANARGEPGETDRAIEVDCRHIGFVWQHPALVAILDALEMDVAQPAPGPPERV